MQTNTTQGVPSPQPSIASTPPIPSQTSRISTGSQQIKPDFTFNADYVFGQEEHSCSVFTLNNNSSLLVEIEQKSTGDRWKGFFDAASL